MKTLAAKTFACETLTTVALTTNGLLHENGPFVIPMRTLVGQTIPIGQQAGLAIQLGGVDQGETYA